jgi:hypothetical protein
MGASCSNHDSEPTGTPSQPAPPAAPELLAGPIINGIDPDDRLTAIAAGDFNGDGVADLALGAAFADGPANSRPEAGEVYVVIGPLPPAGEVDLADDTSVTTLYGANGGDRAGRALTATDLNGDGSDELIVGAPDADRNGLVDAGSVYFLDFVDTPLAPELDLGAAGLPQRDGEAAGDFFGYTLATGDLNGDGNRDLAIAALLADGPDGSRRDAGEVQIFNGGGGLPADGPADSTIFGGQQEDRLGESLSVGDFNGDGRDDLVAAATFAARAFDAGTLAGKTYVFLDDPAASIDLAKDSADVTVVGIDEGDQLGHSTFVADINGDGFDDLILGAVSADGLSNDSDLAGEVVVAFGAASPPTVIDAAENGMPLMFGPPGSRLGRSVAAGNLNADGYADLLAAAPEAPGEEGAEEAGAIYIILGSPEGSLPSNAESASLVIRGKEAGLNLGSHVNGIPSTLMFDVDGDRLDDVIVAAPRAGELRGQVQILYSRMRTP